MFGSVNEVKHWTARLTRWLSGKESAGQCGRQTRVGSLDWEDPLGEDMATHSSILAWEIPWTEEPGGLESVGSQRVRHDLVTKQQQLDNQISDLEFFHGLGNEVQTVIENLSCNSVEGLPFRFQPSFPQS